MNKKNLTINKLALGNLKQRRKQYTILIIGIILAMVFSSSTLFFLYSSNETYREQEFNRMGRQHAIFSVFDDDESIYSKAITDGMITDYALAHIIGFGYTNGDRMPGTAIAWLDDKAKNISNQSFIEGSYPVNENEIAIEKTALSKLGLNVKIGDEITLTVDVQNGEDYSGTVEKTYKLVGIVSDKRYNLDFYGDNAIMIPAAFVAQGAQTEIGGREILSAYVMIPDGVATYEYFFDQSKIGYCYAQFNNAYSYYLTDSFGGIADSGKYIIVIALVMIFASCIAIVNAFNTNLKERKKQIGMLRAVGATKRQIIKIFGREAFIISLISTPVSIAISYGIVRIAISLMSEDAVMTSSFSVLAVNAAVCIAVTMLSALIPLIYASRITPMQAIRNIENNRKMNAKKIKSQKTFDVPALLAKRSTQFYKGGKIAVCAILIATIIFSCFGFSFINYSKNSPSYSGYWDYQLSNMSDGGSIPDYTTNNLGGMSEADKRDIEAYPYFSSVISQKYINAVLEVDEITDYFRCFYEINWLLNFLEEDGENLREFVDSISRGRDILPVPVYSLDQNTVKTLEDSLTAGKINYEKLVSGEEIILVAPQSAKYGDYVTKERIFSSAFYDGEAVPENYNIYYEGESPYSVGDKINISVLENVKGSDEYARTDREVTIGAIVSPRKLGNELEYILNPNDFAFLTVNEGMNNFSVNAKYEAIYIHVDPDAEMDDDIDKTVTDFMSVYQDRYAGYFLSAYAHNREGRDDMKFLMVALLSIVLIAFVVCAAIVNNSLTASIREKKKEIGTLRAVGADIGILVKSYIRQLLSMLCVGYGAGFAAFGVIYAVIALICSMKTYYIFEFIFSPWETLVFCLVLFAICSINLWSKVKKEMKNSIVDNIREL